MLGAQPTLTNEAHHADQAVGSSGLKLIARSPLHYWQAYINSERERKEPTPAMKIGTAWHAAFFEPEEFARNYIEIPQGLDRRTKEGKQLFTELEESGKIPLAFDEMLRIKTMAITAKDHPMSQRIFAIKGGMAEVSMFALMDGVRVKIRPDYFLPPCVEYPNGLIVDGKTGEDMSPSGFDKYAMNWNLALQAAFYVDVFQHVYDLDEPPAFMWCGQEKEAPYSTAWYSASDEVLEYGRFQYAPLLEIYAECMSTGQWPGYDEQVTELKLPAWVKKQMESDDQIMEISYDR